MPEEYLNKTGLSYFWTKIKAYIAGLLGSKANDSDVVHLTGNEIIAGTKNFTSNVYITASLPTYYTKNTAITRNISPSNDVYNSIVRSLDSNNNVTAVFQHVYRTNKASYIRLHAMKGTTTSSDDSAILQLGWDANSNAFATCPSTSSNRSEGTDIVTRDWIPNDTRVVHTSGDEWILGDKHFTNNINIKRNDIDPTQTLDSDKKLFLCFDDKNDSWIGSVECYKRAAGGNDVKLLARNYEDTDNAILMVGFDSNNIPYSYAPSTSSDRNIGNDIVTRNWIPRDTRIVHTTGNEYITGKKYFICDEIPNGNTGGLKVKQINTDWTTTPSVNKYANFEFVDSNEARIGLIEYARRSTSDTLGTECDFKITLERPVAGAGNSWDFFMLGYDRTNNVFFATAPTTKASRSNHPGDIVTRGWLADDTRLVHTTGTEIIAGTKTFTYDVRIKNEYPTLNLYSEVEKRNVAPSGDHYVSILDLYDNSSTPLPIVRLRYAFTTNKRVVMYMVAMNGNSTGTGDSDAAQMGVCYEADGTTYAWCPTPVSSANDNKIATCIWVNTKLSNKVDTNNAQTITGTKTFTANIRVVKDYPEIYMQLGEKRSVTPSASRYYSFINVYDNAATPKRFFLFRGAYYDSRAVSVYMAAFKGTTTSDSDSTTLGVGFTTSGAAFGFCPTPASSSNTNEIATTAWVRTYHSSASDERLKQQIDTVPDEVLDAWEDVDFYQFKFNESVEGKGNNARLHNGVVAQRIDKVFKNHGLDISRYGLYVLEKWDKEPDSLDEDGNVICKGRDAGEQYSIRYTEMLCMEAAYQRRENARLKKRVADLEERLAALELKIS